MPRARKPLTAKLERKQHVTRFLHPLTGKTVRLDLGDGNTFKATLAWLNKIFLNRDYWRDPPAEVPPDIRRLWLGPCSGVPATARKVKGKTPDAAETAMDQAELEDLRDENERLRHEVKRLTKEIEKWKGSAIRKGPCPSLEDARTAWLATYTGRDGYHRKNVEGMTAALVAKFGAATPVDDLAGRERDIDAWLRGLNVSPKRRNDLRTYCLKMLRESGVPLNARAVHSESAKAVDDHRGNINWLTKADAERLHKALPAGCWRDMWRVQASMGFRPDELIVLRRECFGPGFTACTVKGWKHLTVKTGNRTLQIPAKLRPLLRRLVKAGGDEGFCFPNPRTKEPWRDAKLFNGQYHGRLKKAAAAAGLPVKTDCRLARRTCGSILLRNGASTEQVAAVLGNSPAMVRRHYASILPREVSTEAAAI